MNRGGGRQGKCQPVERTLDEVAADAGGGDQSAATPAGDARADGREGCDRAEKGLGHGVRLIAREKRHARRLHGHEAGRRRGGRRRERRHRRRRRLCDSGDGGGQRVDLEGVAAGEPAGRGGAVGADRAVHRVVAASAAVALALVLEADDVEAVGRPPRLAVGHRQSRVRQRRRCVAVGVVKERVVALLVG